MIVRFFYIIILLFPLQHLEADPPILQQEIADSKEESTSFYKPFRFTFPERLLRLCYFRLAVSEEDYLEQFIDLICDTLNVASWHTETFIPITAEKTLEIFKSMGATEYYVSPLDKKGIIHTLIFQAKKLEERIQAHGGSWERIDSDKKTYFAILSPEKTTPEWVRFENSYLSILGWKKQILTLPNGKKKEVLITCENADLIDEEKAYKYCFLNCHANSHSFVKECERAGFYLGMKQDLCFFDNRGVGYSRGIPSEVAFYLDIEAVYNQLMKISPYPTENLWVGGFCAGAPVAAYLKTKLHDQGINFFAEQSFPDLKRDFIETRNFIIRWIGRRSLGGLRSPDIPLNLMGRPPEYKFSIEKMWEKLPYQSKGKVVIIHTLNDQFLPAKVRQRFVEVAQQANRNVIPIFYFSTNQKDVHSDSFYNYPDINRMFIKAIFQQN